MGDWTIAAIAILLIAFAAVSRRLDRSAVTPAIFFVTAGLVAGNEALNVVDLHIGTTPVRVLAEATLTLVLFADASRIDIGALRAGARRARCGCSGSGCR